MRRVAQGKHAAPKRAEDNEARLLDQESERLGHGPKRMKREPERLDQEPERVGQEPELVDQESVRLGHEPKRMKREPEQLDQEPERVSREPEQLDQEPERLDQEPERTSPEPVRMSQEPARLGQNPKPVPRRRKRRGGGSILSNLLIIAGVILLGIAGFMWGQAQWRYHEQDKVNKQLAAYATVYDEEAETKSDGEKTGPKPPEVDWEGLKAINTDIVAWLQMPGTEVNYPIYQAKDNNRYLRNSATGEWSVGGQLFNDFECTRPGLVDALTLTYGHHMLDGTMFKQIAEMDDQETFDEVKTVWYVTEQKAWLLEPLLLYYTHPDDEEVRKFNWTSTDEFRDYLNKRLERAVTKREDAGKIIGSTKHVLALITCNYYDGYGRTVLLCVPKEEAEAAIGQAS